MPKVRCAATCLGGIIKGNHEGIKSTMRPGPAGPQRLSRCHTGCDGRFPV
jgi:hypothetical protein